MKRPKIIPICSPIPKGMTGIEWVSLIVAALIGASIASGIAACMVWAFSEGWKHL